MSDFVATQPLPDDARLHAQPAPATATPRRKCRRDTLLFTSVLVIAAGGAAVMILHKPIEHRLAPLVQRLLHPHSGGVAWASAKIPAPVDPGAVMAENARKAKVASGKGGQPEGKDGKKAADPAGVVSPDRGIASAQPAVAGVTVQHTEPNLVAQTTAHSTVASAIIALKPGSTRTSAVASLNPAAPSPVALSNPGNATSLATTSPSPAASAPSTGQSSKVLPADTLLAVGHPLAVARKPVPAPMMPRQQIAVLSLVSQMGVLVAELRDQNLVLSHEVTAMRTEMDARLGAFGRKLNFEEAKSAIALATRPPATIHPAVHPEIFDPHPPAPAAPVSPASYHVEAASSGVAILLHGDNSLQVSVGDVVPGVGRVLSITQYGAAWVVHTTHGDVR